MGTTQVSIYDMQLQTKYKLLSDLIRITDFIQNISTPSVCLCVRNSMYFFFFFFSYGTSTADFVTYVTIRGTMNYAHSKASVFAYFSIC